MDGKKTIEKTLLVGGCHLELGYLLQFIARARYKAQWYKNVVAACEEPFGYLFEDFADKIHLYPVRTGLKDRWLYNDKPPKVPKGISSKYRYVRIYTPTEDRCKNRKAIWFKYGQELPENTYSNAVLFHARNLPQSWHYDKRIVRGSRNWPNKKWEKLSAALMYETKISIGSKEGAMHIGGTIDYRGLPLSNLCMLMANAKMLVGPSSGPHHLNALCGGRSVAWTHAHKERSLNGKTNKWRLKQGWNPFKSPVKVLDKWGWDVPVDVVLGAVKEYL